tara:strand:+ start:104 stop:391 length:288 start_codon:yes stop_codon:yes gene_type:complete
MEKQILLNVSLVNEKEGGYSAIATDLEVASQGESVEEALNNLKEAVELYVESSVELGIMDQVLERLRISDQDMKEENLIMPKILRTEIPIALNLQ